MFIGSLRKRITLQTPSPTQDSLGAEVADWTDVITVWGGISPASARQMQAAEHVLSTITHTITLRWLGTGISIDPSMRAVYKGRTFTINGVLDEDERERTLTLSCTERVGED